MSTRRGGIPGPESRTGLVRPAMSEAEFERRQAQQAQAQGLASHEHEAGPGDATGDEPAVVAMDSAPRSSSSSNNGNGNGSRRTSARGKTASKPRRIQRMFAIEEDLDKKLWLYAIHMGKDRSEVVNDVLRPLVASMVLYDSRDRRSSRTSEPTEAAEG